MIIPSLYDLMLFLHVVLFVYWLGPDWGVYVMAPGIWNKEAEVSERRRWALTLVRLSQISRNSLILLIPVGVTLAYELGTTSLTVAAVIGVWIVALSWVTVSVIMYHKRGTPLGDRMTQLDQGMRFIMIPGLIAVGLATLIWQSPFDQNWIAVKLMVFGFLLFNSIQQRTIALKWVGALSQLDKATSAEEKAQAEAVFERTAQRSKINAYLTWTGTLIIAFFGVTKLI